MGQLSRAFMVTGLKMDKEVFFQKTKAQKRYITRAIFFGLIPYFLVIFIGLFLYFKTDIRFVHSNKLAFELSILMILVLIGLLPLILGYFNMRKLKLFCPFCNKLLSAKDWDEISNSLSCSNCGKKIII